MPIPIITSRQNARVQRAVKLRDRRQRKKQNRILIDGIREIGHAIQAGIELDEAFVCDALLPGEEGRRLVQSLVDAGVEVAQVTQDVFMKLAFGQRTEGVVASARAPFHDLSSLRLPPNPIVAVLENIEKPGNIGAIARSADAAGVAAIIVADGRTDLFNPNAIRASLGLLFSVPVAETSAQDTLDWLRAHAIPMYAARPDADRIYSDVDFSAGGAIILGNEADGISCRWIGDDIRPVRLPMLGIADSLNVSVAAAILFYETLRQRAKNPG
ncbi:MAG: RNA methyltransferase [Pirellulales bacterium]|nr:RNA methyltransferase [Pirellulales bacterium]